MTGTDHGFVIRRIVVAIDSSVRSAALLDAAAALAVRLHAELEGLFVEDVNLARLAELPVGREVCFNGMCRDFTAVELTTQYREQEIVARRAIAAAAAKARIAHAFRVARGQVDVEVISAAGSADLLVLGMGAATFGRRGRLGQTARAVAERAPRTVLIAKPGVHDLTTPLVYFDGSPGSRRALAAAVGIFATRDATLTVLIVAADRDSAARLREAVAAQLAPLDVQPRFLHSPQPTPAQICRFATDAGADVLVIGADARFSAEADRLRLLETIACPVLLVR